MADIIAASPELIATIERNFESKDLDYKAPIEWCSTDKKACCELTKDVMAMANTQGGCIVIGVSELDHGFSLDGLSDGQARSFESSAVCRFVQNYVDPPINVRVQKVSHKGLLFVVLEVPRFIDTPHICQKDYPDVLRARELYVRTDNNESAPIKSSADFRLLIESALRNRTDSLLSSFRAILTGNTTKNVSEPSAEEQFNVQIQSARDQFDNRNPLKEKGYTYFVETIFSLQEFDHYHFVPNKLQAAAQKASITFTGWPFLFIHYNRPDCLSTTEDGLESLIATQDFAGKDMLDFWRFNESGLFYKKELQFNSDSKPPQASGPGIIRHFAEAIYCLTRLYEDLLPENELITLSVTFLGTRGRTLVWNDFGPHFLGSNLANRPQIEIHASHTLAEWRAGLEDHVVEMAQQVFQFFQHQHTNTQIMKTQIQNLFSRKF
jgi:hypothetical protein